MHRLTPRRRTPRAIVVRFIVSITPCPRLVLARTRRPRTLVAVPVPPIVVPMPPVGVVVPVPPLFMSRAPCLVPRAPRRTLGVVRLGAWRWVSSLAGVQRRSIRARARGCVARTLRECCADDRAAAWQAAAAV